MRVRTRAILALVVALAGGWGLASLGEAAPSPEPVMPVPADNPMSPAKAELGRRLFYDAGLSADGSMSCASCHEQAKGFSDGLDRHVGVTGERGLRNVPGLANAGWRSPLTWADQSVLTLEQQAMVPMTGDHPVEMGLKGHEDALLARLRADPCYAAMFARAFPGQPVDMQRVTQALASFERTLVSASSPYDRFRAGQGSALSAQAAKGAKLFAAAGCAACHTGRDLTDNGYHYVGTTIDGSGPSYMTTNPNDLVGKLRTPALRNVAVTGPWLHDGSAGSVEEAIRRHAAQAIVGVDMGALLAFMDAQTDRVFLENVAFKAPAGRCDMDQPKA